LDGVGLATEHLHEPGGDVALGLWRWRRRFHALWSRPRRQALVALDHPGPLQPLTGDVRVAANGPGNAANGAVLLPETTALGGVGEDSIRGSRSGHLNAPPRRHACPSARTGPDAAGPGWGRPPRPNSQQCSVPHWPDTTRWPPSAGWARRDRRAGP